MPGKRRLHADTLRVLVRLRRQRRAAKNSALLRFASRFSVVLAALLSLLYAFLVIALYLAFTSVIRDLPSPHRMAELLDEQKGLLRQPTRLVDRTGQHTLFTLSPAGGERTFLSYGQYSQNLVLATLVLAQPDFWESPGYDSASWQDPGSHPTLAQQLVYSFLLADEAPTTDRALRERFLAAQVTADYGREQVLAWALNSTDYGHFAVGAEAASQLYLGKSASDLSLAEASLLAFIGQAPALNPFDAPAAAEAGRREVLSALLDAGWITPQEALAAASELPVILPEQEISQGLVSTQFLDLVLHQLNTTLGVGRAQRGGLVIYTSIDYALQLQVDCALRTQLSRLAGSRELLPAWDGSSCSAGSLLPWMELKETAAGVAAGALVLDPSTGQFLAAAGDLAYQPAGTSILPFIYLAGFSRGLSPATLGWDIPSGEPVLGQVYQGPVRLRLALVNDYLPPARTVIDQVGEQVVALTAGSLGLDFPASGLLERDFNISPFDLSMAYGILAEEGIWKGRQLSPSPGLLSIASIEQDPRLDPVSILQLKWTDGSFWQDWSGMENRFILTPQLSYLVTHVLGDVSARSPSQVSSSWLEIGSPSAVKQARTLDQRGVWTVGYTPGRVVTVFISGAGAGSRPAADGLWGALARTAMRDLPPLSWKTPPGLVFLNVCDPSGLLPTDTCPGIVEEIFLEGFQPVQVDTLFQEIEINKETGQLATVFTPAQWVEKRVYMFPPLSAREWAQAAGIPVPPSSYDRYKAPAYLPDVHITSPAMFSDGHGLLEIRGTAAGEDFVSYRLEYGYGLNPDRWYLLGEDVNEPVSEGLLGMWDTSALEGLYTLRLMVLRTDFYLQEAILQLTLDNTPPMLSIRYPREDQQVSMAEEPTIMYRAEAQDSFLVQVLFYLDGEQLAVDSEAPFWLVLPSEIGGHVLRVVAEDRVGNTTEALVNFTVVE